MDVQMPRANRTPGKAFHARKLSNQTLMTLRRAFVNSRSDQKKTCSLGNLLYNRRFSNSIRVPTYNTKSLERRLDENSRHIFKAKYKHSFARATK